MPEANRNAGGPKVIWFHLLVTGMRPVFVQRMHHTILAMSGEFHEATGIAAAADS